MTEKSQREVTQGELAIAQKYMSKGYYYWYWMHIILGIATIVLPASAAFAPVEHLPYVKIIAGVGAIFGAVYAFVRPHEIASAYDWACQEVWKVDIAFNLQTIDEAEVSKRLSKAISATTFKYVSPGASEAQTEERLATTFRRETIAAVDQWLATAFRRETIAAVDQWRLAQPEHPSRPDAIRRLVEKVLSVDEPHYQAS